MTVAKMKWDENHERHFLARLMHWSAVQILVLPNSLIIISVMWYEREYGCSCWEEHDSITPFLCFSLLCCTSMERVCQKNCRKWPVVSDQFFLITFKKKKRRNLVQRVGEGISGFYHVTAQMLSVWIDRDSFCHCLLTLLCQVFVHDCLKRTGCDQFKMALSDCMKDSLWDTGGGMFMIYSDRVFTLLLKVFLLFFSSDHN